MDTFPKAHVTSVVIKCVKCPCCKDQFCFQRTEREKAQVSDSHFIFLFVIIIKMTQPKVPSVVYHKVFILRPPNIIYNFGPNVAFISTRTLPHQQLFVVHVFIRCETQFLVLSLHKRQSRYYKLHVTICYQLQQEQYRIKCSCVFIFRN